MYNLENLRRVLGILLVVAPFIMLVLAMAVEELLAVEVSVSSPKQIKFGFASGKAVLPYQLRKLQSEGYKINYVGNFASIETNKKIYKNLIKNVALN